MSSQTNDHLLTASAAARILGVSETAIRKRIKAGTLSATKESGSWQIPSEEVERLKQDSNPNRTKASNQTEPHPSRSDDGNRESIHREGNDNTSPSLEPNQTESNSEVEVLKTQLASLTRENAQFHKQVEYLQTQNDHLTQLLAVAHKSVGQLTEQNQLLLEDHRKKRRPFWKRLLGRGQVGS